MHWRSGQPGPPWHCVRSQASQRRQGRYRGDALHVPPLCAASTDLGSVLLHRRGGLSLFVSQVLFSPSTVSRMPMRPAGRLFHASAMRIVCGLPDAARQARWEAMLSVNTVCCAARSRHRSGRPRRRAIRAEGGGGSCRGFRSCGHLVLGSRRSRPGARGGSRRGRRGHRALDSAAGGAGGGRCTHRCLVFEVGDGLEVATEERLAQHSRNCHTMDEPAPTWQELRHAESAALRWGPMGYGTRLGQGQEWSRGRHSVGSSWRCLRVEGLPVPQYLLRRP